MAKFSDNAEGYSEQIRNMRADGKKYSEIIAFFKENYKINLYTNLIVSACKNKKSGGVASDERPRRKAAQRRYLSKKSQPELNKKRNHHKKFSLEEIEFTQHIKAAWEMFKKKFFKEIELAIFKKNNY